ncbi:MAG: N-acetyltransferase family protein [Pseudomonadota bacterium]
MAAITELYAPLVENSVITFELEAPTADEMARRWQVLMQAGCDYLVAEGPEKQVLGYAYYGPFRSRAAYAHCVENSVYIAPKAQRTGLGRALMEALIERASVRGLKEMIAVITDAPDTAYSIAFHSALGFADAGRLRGVGHKFNRWLDVRLMQRRL